MVTKQSERLYDPESQRIQNLLAQCAEDWATPEENRKFLLPFGIKPLDKAVYGMDTRNGELILLQGPEKGRKTTVAMNIVANYMMGDKPVEKPLTIIDTLESGMTPKRYRDAFVALVATRWLLAQGHVAGEFCPVCKSASCHMLGLSPEFLMFNTRKPEQQKAIDWALQEMAKWPMMIFGASLKEGETRNLENSVTGGVDFQSRWNYLIDIYDAKVFVTDHLQQYSFFESLSDYEKQQRTIAAVSDVVSQRKIVNILISQISLTSQREAASGTGKYYASGGKKAAAEATIVLSCNYADGANEVTVTLEQSRRSKPLTITHPLEPTSGAFYGEPTAQEGRTQFRPGMETAEAGGYNGKQHGKK